MPEPPTAWVGLTSVPLPLGSAPSVVVADVLARTLSILSLVIIAFGAVIAFMTYRRDRPRLALRWGVRYSERVHQLEVTVMNHGRQPIVVEEVAIQDVPVRSVPPPLHIYPRPLRRLIGTLRRRRRPWIGGSAVLADGEPRSVMLRPGSARTYPFSLDRLRELVHSEALYASAVDPIGREVTLPLPVQPVAEAVAGLESMKEALEPPSRESRP
jgi:hypothetical protein